MIENENIYFQNARGGEGLPDPFSGRFLEQFPSDSRSAPHLNSIVQVVGDERGGRAKSD